MAVAKYQWLLPVIQGCCRLLKDVVVYLALLIKVGSNSGEADAICFFIYHITFLLSCKAIFQTAKLMLELL